MIDVDDSIRAILFRSGDHSDWMCAVNELQDGTIVCKYRFRYDHPDTHPDEPNSDKDARHWYEMTIKPEERGGKSAQDLIEAMQKISDAMGETGFTPPGGCACTLVRGLMTAEQFHREFVKLPFVRLRRSTRVSPKGPPP